MKKTLKKSLSCILTMCMLAPYATVALAESETVLFHNDFNSYATNETETSLTVDNTVPYVVDVSPKNKGMQIKTGISKGTVSAKWNESPEKMVIAFDVMQSVERSAVDICVLNSKGKETKIAYIGQNGSICTYDGKSVGGIALDRIKEIAFKIDTFENTFSVYVDKKGVLSSWRLPATDIYPYGVKFVFGSGATNSAEVYLDNIRAYSGENIYKTFPESEYNEKTVDIINASETLGTAIIKESKYDLPVGTTTGLGMNVKSNLAEIRAEGDNTYLHCEHLAAEDMHADVSFNTELNYLMVQTDFRFMQFGSPIYPTILRDNTTGVSNADFNTGTIKSNGVWNLSNGKAVYTFKTNKWYNIATGFNLANRTYNVWIDYELVAENVPISLAGMVRPSLVRIWVIGSSPTTFDMDNLRVYEAVEPKESLDELSGEWVSLFSDGTREKAVLDGKTAISTANGLTYKDGVKEITQKPEAKDGDYYVSAEVAKNLLGDLPPKYTDKVPLKAAAKEKGLEVYENEDLYLLIFSENAFKADDKLMSEVSAYMKMPLPDADEIKADVAAKNVPHPRIIGTAADFEKIRNEINVNPEIAAWHKKLIAKAESNLKTDVEIYEWGFQDNILTIAREFKEKMILYGYAWQITGDKKYPEAAWKEFESVCSFPDWNPDHSLDTGELLFGAAIGYDWMYDAFTPEQKKFIEEGTLKLGIEVIRSAYYGRLYTDNGQFTAPFGEGFATGSTNFNVVVNGGLTAAALAFSDIYPDICFDAVSQSIKSLGKMLPNFEPDGGWIEGPNYWNYATQYLAHMVGALETACGTSYGILTHPGVAATPYYALYLESHQGINNFSDTAHMDGWNSFQFGTFGRYMNDKALTYQRYNAIVDKNYDPTVWDMIYYDPSAKTEKPTLPLDRRITGVELVTMREDWERSDSLFFSTHGGENGVYHAHYDGGTFVFDILGERWALDLGMDMLSYIGNAGVNLYRFRAEGHNMLVFNPSSGADLNMDSITSVKRFETAPKGGILVYDNSGAYSPWTTEVTRGFFVGDERRSLTVRDEFTVKEKNTDVYWQMQTPASIEIDGMRAILTINGKKLLVEVASSSDNVELIAAKAVPFETSPKLEGMVDDSNKNKLQIKLKTSGTEYIEVKMSALGEPASESGMINKPISEWKLPEGELIKRGDSTLSGINSGGKPLHGFAPNTTSYTIGVLEGTPIPAVEAFSNNGRVEVDMAENTDDVTTITSYDTNGYYKTVYVISYKQLKIPTDVFGMTRHIVYDLAVSSTPEAANVGPNMLDGDLTTRWAGNGAGENALFDLGSVKPIDAIAIAYEWGDERKYSFEIEVSKDGEYYEPLWKGASCGYTEDMELIELDNRVEARYVKFIGGGNTVNAWNGVREFAILQKK